MRDGRGGGLRGYAAAARGAARVGFGSFFPVSRFESGRQHQVRRSQCVRYEGSLSAIGRLRQSVPRVVSAGRRCTRPRRTLRLCSGERYGAAIMQRERDPALREYSGDTRCARLGARIGHITRRTAPGRRI